MKHMLPLHKQFEIVDLPLGVKVIEMHYMLKPVHQIKSVLGA